MKTGSECVIFFADVVGSTKLYETFGDEPAHNSITKALEYVTARVQDNAGSVVEIIGDEVMAMFDRPADACQCACAIHRFFARGTQDDMLDMRMRVGFHRGEVGFKEGHPFGDTVNVASRLASLAGAGQSVTSAETVAGLPKLGGVFCYPFGEVKVKGKTQPLQTIKVDWDVDAATALVAKSHQSTAPGVESSIELRHGDIQLFIHEDDVPFSIGRAPHCSHTVSSSSSSRSHMVIELRYGKWVLVDRSTNGTYVKVDPASEQRDTLPVHLHHAEWVIEGHGYLGLGKQPEIDDPDSIEFHCKVLED